MFNITRRFDIVFRCVMKIVVIIVIVTLYFMTI